MRLGILVFVVQCDKVRKVIDTRQIKMRRGEASFVKTMEAEGTGEWEKRNCLYL
jgi:hypothetical protein